MNLAHGILRISLLEEPPLAYFFNKLQLAQAEGQGIPTILRLMKEKEIIKIAIILKKMKKISRKPPHKKNMKRGK